MNWFKKAKHSITLEDIYRIIDDLIVENITEKDIEKIFLRNRLNSINYRTDRELQRAAQTIGINQGETESLSPYQKQKIMNLIDSGEKVPNILKKLKLPEKLVINFIKSRFPTNKHRIHYLTEKYRSQIIDVLEDRSYTEDASKTTVKVPEIARRLNVNKSVVISILRRHGISINKYIAERTKWIEDRIVEFVQSLSPPPKSMMEAYQQMISEYPAFRNLSYPVFRKALFYRNMNQSWGYNSNSVFTAFRTFLLDHVNNRQPMEKIVNGRKLEELADIFVRQYGKYFGFIEPMEQESIKLELIEKTRLLFQTQSFYKQVIPNNVIRKKILYMIEGGVDARTISEQLGVPLNQVEKIYEIYTIKNEPSYNFDESDIN